MLDTEWDSPRGHVRRTVESGADLYTDAGQVYVTLRDEYKHQSVDHHRGEYARGRVGTNGIENFWALLKRALHGTYAQVDEQHLFRYVDERVFAFNLRNLNGNEISPPWGYMCQHLTHGTVMSSYRLHASPRIDRVSRVAVRTCRTAIVQVRQVLDRVEADLFRREQSLTVQTPPSGMYDLRNPPELTPARRAAFDRLAARARANRVS